MDFLKIASVFIGCILSVSDATESRLYPDMDEGCSFGGDGSMVCMVPQRETGYLYFYDAEQNGRDKKLELPITEYEKANLVIRMNNEKKPEITKDQFRDILQLFMKQEIQGISPQSTFEDIWSILLYNNIYIRFVPGTEKGYVFELVPPELKTIEDENEYIYRLNGEGQLRRYLVQ